MRGVAPAAQGPGGEADGTADEEVLGILQRRPGYGDHRAAEFVLVGVAAVAVPGVLDDTQELAGESRSRLAQDCDDSRWPSAIAINCVVPSAHRKEWESDWGRPAVH